MTALDQTVSGVPGRYAGALYDLADQAQAVDQVGADLASFQALLERSDDLLRLVRSPVFSAEDQIRALDAICREVGIGGLALNFIRLVARNRRLFALPDMIRGYGALVARARGEVRADVTSAEPLSARQTDELKAALKVAIGRDAQLAMRSDPSILGGLIVRVGSKMMDNSLKTKLQNLKLAMKGIG